LRSAKMGACQRMGPWMGGCTYAVRHAAGTEKTAVPLTDPARAGPRLRRVTVVVNVERGVGRCSGVKWPGREGCLGANGAPVSPGRCEATASEYQATPRTAHGQVGGAK
jgi:hypothetical protein